jgi:hypothetical protein
MRLRRGKEWRSMKEGSDEVYAQPPQLKHPRAPDIFFFDTRTPTDDCHCHCVSGAPRLKFCGIKWEKKASMLRKTGKPSLLADYTYLTTFRNPTTREGSRSEPDQTTNNTRAERLCGLKIISIIRCYRTHLVSRAFGILGGALGGGSA